MANKDTDLAIDWTQCEWIECVPGKVSGRPVVRGTRIMPEAIVGSYDLGETIEELREGFPTLSVAQIKRLIGFAHAQREQHHSPETRAKRTRLRHGGGAGVSSVLGAATGLCAHECAAR